MITTEITNFLNSQKDINSDIKSINLESKVEFLGYDNHFIQSYSKYITSFSFETLIENRSKRNRYITQLLVDLNKLLFDLSLSSEFILLIDMKSLFQNTQIIHLYSK